MLTTRRSGQRQLNQTSDVLHERKMVGTVRTGTTPLTTWAPVQRVCTIVGIGDRTPSSAPAWDTVYRHPLLRSTSGTVVLSVNHCRYEAKYPQPQTKQLLILHRGWLGDTRISFEGFIFEQVRLDSSRVVIVRAFLEDESHNHVAVPTST